MSAGEIPRIRGDDVAAIADAVRRREPVVLTGGRRGLAKRLVDRWTFDYLRRTAGPAATFPVHYAPRGSAFPRVYGAGLGAGGIARASIAGFVDAVEARTDLGLYLQTPVVVFDEDAPDHRRPECGRVANLGPALLGDVSRDVDWDLLHAALAGAGKLELCQLWAGDGTGATPAHYDRNENFLAQIRGRKHVLLVGAAHVFDVLAPASGGARPSRAVDPARAAGLPAYLPEFVALYEASWIWTFSL